MFDITIVQICDFIGTIAFAISGIRLASAKRFDLFGAYVVGLTTAIGGGTLRDLMLSRTPFWMESYSYLICSAIALVWVILFRKLLVRHSKDPTSRFPNLDSYCFRYDNRCRRRCI